MKYAFLISVRCDLSEEALKQAWHELHEPDLDACVLTVGVRQASEARSAPRLAFNRPIAVYVNPEWTTEWMLSTPQRALFSEGV